MFHKKTLSAAIAVALSFGVGAAQAASFEKYLTKDYISGSLSTDHQINQSLKYAYEQFGTGSDAGDLAFPFRVRYTLSKAVPNDIDLYVSFTLSGGATWQENLSSSNLTIQDSTGTLVAAPEIAIVNGGNTAASTVTFLISTTKKSLDTSQILDFTFKVGSAEKVLQSPGGKITLTSTLVKAQKSTSFTVGEEADQSLATDLALSQEGTIITFEQADVGNPAYISVEADGKTFEGPGLLDGSPTKVAYGVIRLKDDTSVLQNSSTCVPKSYLVGNGNNVTGCTESTWTSVGQMTEGSITIEDGNFSASGKPSDGMVYLDTATKISADEFTNATLAKWALDTADFNALLAAGSDRNIVLSVNGTTEIIENRQTQPRGTLVIKFGSGNSVTRTAFLRHLKKNGTVCTLYNIPPSDALDIVNIRITNDSATVSGFVKGKLRDMDNKLIFQKTVVEQGSLEPHQTVRLQMADLTADGSSWKGRAVLTLESNIPHPKMQVYGLLRAREATGFPETPLMNMSTGATGNSCD
jgi:hypothetical protein